MKSHPRSAAAIEAEYCYLALPKEITDNLSLEEFTKEVEDLLVASGDLDRETGLATALGESHGLHNCSTLEWDDDIENVTRAVPTVRANKSGQKYIKSLVESRYEGFDEEKNRKSRGEPNDRMWAYGGFLDHYEISRKAYNLAVNLAEGRLREWFHDLLYVCLDEEDIGPFLKAFKDKTNHYDEEEEDKRKVTFMSGEELNLIIKEKSYYDGMFTHDLAFPIREDKIIFHFEDIKAPEVQEILGEKLFSMKHSNLDLWSSINSARVILISTLMPYEYHIENDKLRKFVLSAPAYDLRTTKKLPDEIHSVTLKGRIADQPRYRESPTNTSTVEFSLAGDPAQPGNPMLNGFDCVAFYNLGDFVFCNFEQGDEVVVMGKLHNRSWTDEEGRQCSKVEIVCDNVYAVPVEIPQKDENKDEDEDDED